MHRDVFVQVLFDGWQINSILDIISCIMLWASQQQLAEEKIYRLNSSQEIRSLSKSTLCSHVVGRTHQYQKAPSEVFPRIDLIPLSISIFPSTGLGFM